MNKKYLIKTLLLTPLLFSFFFNTTSASFNFEEIILIKDDGNEIFINKNDFSNWIDTSIYLKYTPNYTSQIENVKYCDTPLIICNITKNERARHSLKKTDLFSIDKKLVTSFMEDLARKYDKDPIDATFTIENDRVTAFSLSTDGKKINIEENSKNIINLLKKGINNKVEITYDTIKPDIKSNDANKLGIKTLIGIGESNFKGSTKSRIHNIQVAASRFDGVLIKPGEELSFVEILGPVDGEHGYKQELVIKNNETTPEYGGGVCQVSTTAFRAAIYSGLEITARKNHSYPVHYYNPQGLDAAVYIPRPDLRFKNNTPGHILIQTEVDASKNNLFFRFYGTDDGRSTKVDGPYTLSREADGSMKTTFTQTVLDTEGNIIVEDTFRSNYDSPNKYPQPGQESILTKKPSGWSSNEWKKYKKANGL